MKNKITIILISTILIFSIIFVGAESLQNKGTLSIKSNSEWIVEHSTDTDYSVYIADKNKQQTQICLLSKTATKTNDLADRDLSTSESKESKDKTIQPKIKATKISSKDSKLEKDYYGYCYNPTKEKYLKFGTNSTTLVYNEFSKVDYVLDNFNVSAILKKCTNNNLSNCTIYPSDIRIINASNFKFGAVDTISKNDTEYQYQFYSTNPIKQDEFGYYITTESFKKFLWITYGQTENNIRINLKDICADYNISTKVYRPNCVYNLDKQVSSYNQIGNLSIPNYDYILTVWFKGFYNKTSDSIFIDPNYNIQSSDVFKDYIGGVKVENNYSHLPVYDASSTLVGFNLMRRLNYPYQVDDDNSYAHFNGVFNNWEDMDSNAIDLGNADNLNLGNFTISLWVKVDSFGQVTGGVEGNPDITSEQMLINKYNGNYQGYVLNLHEDGLLSFEALNGTGYGNNFLSTNSIKIGRWYNILVTYNTENMSIYFDGKIDSNQTISSPMVNAVITNLTLGQDSWDGLRTLNGSLDNVLIINRSLNSTEVQSIYNLGRKDTTYTDSALISSYRFDNSSLGIAVDSYGTNNGTLGGQVNYGLDVFGLTAYYPFDVQQDSNNLTTDYSNFNIRGLRNKATWNSSCLYGGCYQFNGLGTDYISLDNQQIDHFGEPYSNYTVTLWFNAKSYGDQSLMEKWTQITYPFTLRMNNDGSGFRCAAWNSSGSTPETGNPTATLPVQSLNEWHFMACVYNNNITVYNGTSNSTEINTVYGQDISNNGAFSIGARNVVGNSPFDGKIDEVMFFNRALNSSEILDIYNNQSKRFLLEANQTIKQFGINLNGNLFKLSENKIVPTNTDLNKRIGYWNTSYGYNESMNGLIAYWHLDNDAALGENYSKIVDSVGGNNGTFNTNVTFSDSVFSKGVTFSGLNDSISYVNTNAVPILSSDIKNESATFVAWLKPGKQLITECCSISIMAPSNVTDYSYSIGNGMINILAGSEAQYTRFSGFYLFGGDRQFDTLIFNIDGQHEDLYGNFLLMSNGNWSHVVSVINKTVYNLTYANYTITNYYNGIPLESNSALARNNVSLVIKNLGGPWGENTYNGSMDEIMLFNRSLSDSEIKELYIKGRAKFNYTNYQTTDYFSLPISTSNILLDYKLDSDPFGFFTPILGSGISADSFNTSFFNGTLLFSGNTPSNDSYQNSKSLFIETLYDDTYFLNITYNLFNSVLNTTTFFTPTYSITYLNLSDGTYLYNASLTNNNSVYNTEQRTVTIDTVSPSFLTTTLTTTAGSTTILFNYLINDTNLNTCKFTIYDVYGIVNGFNNNLPFTCNNPLGIYATTGIFGVFNLSVTATDKAGNSNTTTQLFLTSTSGGYSGPTGGGSTTITQNNPSGGTCGDGICDESFIYNGKSVMKDHWNCPNDCGGYNFDELFLGLTGNCIGLTNGTCIWFSNLPNNSSCGDKICSASENQLFCPNDCGYLDGNTLLFNCISGKGDCFYSSSLGIVFIIVLIGGILFLIFYKVDYHGRKVNLPNYYYTKIKKKRG